MPSALLSGIRLSTASDNGKSILVTSTQPDEGKTTVASCLAITALRAGQTVLLIDGDLRRPRLGSAAGIDNGVGLGEILSGQAEAEEAIHQVELFNGAQQAARSVSWERVGLAIFTGGRRPGRYCLFSQRRVLLDLPPILAANDAPLLGGIRRVLLVIGAGSADRDEVRRAKEQLELINTPVIGAVLNQFDPKTHGRPNQPYQGYYLHPRR
jgi:Mrp family chromosome partitioning ATPase